MSLSQQTSRTLYTSSIFNSSSVFKSLVGLPSSYKSFVPEGASAFVTYDRRGRRVKNGQYTDAEPLRWTTSNGKAGDQKATVITYSFAPGFSLNGLSDSEVRSIFREALQTWARHAPIEFVEVKDPGEDDLVDIRVDDDSIDGKGNTLAFAFFPTFGDITFDNSESWNSNKYRETAVHEIGHALGLDHEDDVDAIMNSVLRNRFEDEKSFLLADDIKGIQNLYGIGEGSVTALDGNTVVDKTLSDSEASPPLVNLVTNGSFEAVSVVVGDSRAYKRIQGWSTLSGIGFQVDRSVEAADGTVAINLNPFETNSTIYQNVKTEKGERYELSLAFNDSGETKETTALAVFWEGKQIDQIEGNGSGQWRQFDYLVEGGTRNVSTLAFRALRNPNPQKGTIPNVLDPTVVFIDDVVVTAAREPFSSNLLQTETQKVAQKADIGTGEASDSYRDPLTGERSSLVADDSLFSLFQPKPGQSWHSFI
ncbi:MAG: matrixin family metalloprotease [Cyanobacteria bacterium P01_D01_bin.105]